MVVVQEELGQGGSFDIAEIDARAFAPVVADVAYLKESVEITIPVDDVKKYGVSIDSVEAYPGIRSIFDVLRHYHWDAECGYFLLGGGGRILRPTPTVLVDHELMLIQRPNG